MTHIITDLTQPQVMDYCIIKRRRVKVVCYWLEEQSTAHYMKNI